MMERESPGAGLAKSHRSALVAIPPEEAWGPIQAIRRIHDRKFERWMPHVTLLYPFRPAADLAEAAGGIATACAGRSRFEVRLDRFAWFAHGPSSATVWLAPEPAEPLVALQAALEARFPDCDEAAGHAGGFVPHLSVGQARGAAEAERVARVLGASWKRLAFEVAEIAAIAREEEGPFRVARRFPLLGAARA